MYRALLLNEKRFLQRNKTHVVAKKQFTKDLVESRELK